MRAAPTRGAQVLAFGQDRFLPRNLPASNGQDSNLLPWVGFAWGAHTQVQNMRVVLGVCVVVEGEDDGGQRRQNTRTQARTHARTHTQRCLRMFYFSNFFGHVFSAECPTQE